MPDPSIGSKIHFQHMIDQSILAEKLGYSSVSIPEHHLVNLLMIESDHLEQNKIAEPDLPMLERSLHWVFELLRRGA